MTGRLTTHVLDTTTGLPAAGIPLRLYARTDPPTLLAQTTTNADGRCEAPLLAGTTLQPGRYDLVFTLGAYFARLNPNLPDPPFIDEVVLRFAIADASRHTHVPLLVSPFGYTTYRGS
jgi:5-hydroxyisourate hydrolase